MVYYRRRRYYRSKVTKMRFQSFVDISTQADNMQIISVNAGGRDVVKRLAPFFAAHKYYRLGSVSIKLIPASTLPVDPTGLSYEAGENTVDPRDQLTPGMCRITNGEDILENITGLTGDQQRQLYDNMLLDSRWFKWMLQSGVKRSASPRYWQIGQLHQDKWPGAVMNIPEVTKILGGTEVVGGTDALWRRSYSDPLASPAVDNVKQETILDGSSRYGLFQVGHKGRLGWMPTDALQRVWATESNKAFNAAVPEIELFKILMPPMHKTNYYYRMFITETVYFKDPIVMNVNGYRPIDVFTYANAPMPQSPKVAHDYAYPDDITDGGNDGSN